MIFAIDIDGTLTLETEGWDYENRTPNLARIAGVNRLFRLGYTIILWSSRYGEDLEVTKTWLDKYGVLYSEIILDKMQYHVIIDDKSVPLNFLEIT